MKINNIKHISYFVNDFVDQQVLNIDLVMSGNYDHYLIIQNLCYSLHAILISYSNSDDNLLKNIELFDKVSLRFNGRILFIKDVIGSQEICCWSFYGHGQKLAEVCCTSIVYGTDKKHTKVHVKLLSMSLLIYHLIYT